MLRNNVLLCFVLSATSAFAATPAAPKVAFAGDGFVYEWAQSPQFQANSNWTSYATPSSIYQASATAALDFPSVIASHPAYVFIDTGMADLGGQTFEFTAGHDWSTASTAITSMVAQAQAAGIRVILGTVPVVATTTSALGNFDSDLLNDWVTQYGESHNIPVVNLQYWLAHGCAGVMLSPCALATPGIYGGLDPTAAGYAFIDILVQQAIAEYGLTIKSGYLSNVQTVNNPVDGQPPAPLAAGVNQECTGGAIQFTPWATWSDGVSREMLNTPYGGTLGTWRSDNPAVMGVNSHGMAYAYAPGTATIWFTSASGQTFSPWKVTVFSAYPGGS